MSGDCRASVVEVRIGHVVIPRTSATAAAASAAVLPSVEPAHKRARTEALAAPSSTSAPADVVTAATWSEEAITEALRQYALAALAEASREAVKGRDSSPSAAAAAAVLKGLNDLPSSRVAAWPAVRLSPTRAATDDNGSEATKSSAADWSAVSFSFVPRVLEASVSASASGAAVPDAAFVVDATTLRVMAAIPLPRALCVPYHAGSAEAKAGSCTGCVSAVLVECIRICASTAIPRPVLSCDEHSHTPRPALLPCVDGVLSAELRARPLFLVGAGGIGCEVLKVLVLSGFTQIHLIDLDTIDATNLNRQFLFQAADVGRSKADTARRVVLEWFAAPDDPVPDCASALRDRRTPPCIVAYHDNVKTDRYDDAFYRQFAVVLSALDNVSARQHVNRMCMRNNIPLIESGTMGYNGQVQPILKDVYECYDCRPKPPEAKTFAVCTIHARPTTMVHCVHYAKELYETLFGGGSSDTDGEVASTFTAAGTTAEAGAASAISSQEKSRHGAPAPSDGGELSYLHSMISEWRRRLSAPSPGCTGAATGSFAEASSTPGRHGNDCEGNCTSSAAALAAELLRLLFVAKVEELLSMKASWSTKPPEPLSQRDIDRVAAAYMSASASGAFPTPLSGDHVLSVQGCMELFLRAVTECLARPNGLPFKKEDDIAVRFVSATANMRAHVFHIAEQSLEEVRSIAGSIVPAIATTNATIAGAVVHELISLLRSSVSPPGSATAAQLAPLSEAESTGGPASASVQASPRAHVVYARKAPQLRRRRVPRPAGERRFAPALFMEYAGDGAPSPNGGVSKSATHYAPLQAALALVGADHSTADPFHLHSAAEGGGKAGRSAAVMDHYVVHSTVPNPPSRLHCLVCQDVHPEVCVSLNLRTATLGQFVHRVLEDALGLEAPSVSREPVLLYEDEDYEALAERMLADVLQCSPADEAQVSHRHQRYTLTVDGLNKGVSWSVVLMHADMEAAAPISSPSAVLFEVSGLERAVAAEERALARLAARQERRDEEVDEGSRRAPLGTTPLASSSAATAAPVTVDVIISDDDEALEVVPAKNGASSVPKGNDVIVLD
ncbi:hypothetical protein GH5_07522 [Leishmania sp. Ghana 2012 LV757]|uniref:hypothetical protein n=1 Tax=Leishmania sp. Ghana 2012 LV757 TaxID=2803181 RepID=UPI001B679A09|nr:hypothetical protein GH5_07522 [Leishmania sp. Ghana 2012 LV757]